MSSTTSDRPAGEKLRGPLLLALLAILGLAAVLRFHAIGADSLWHDEVWSVEMTVGRDGQQYLLPETGVLNPAPDLVSLDPAIPWWQIWTHMRLDNHPPLYTVLLRFWREAFGASEAAVRSLSAVVSLIAILGMFDTARLRNGIRPALWACLLMAVAAPQIQYAQEARSYALLLAEGMIAAAALTRLEVLGASTLRAVVLALAVMAMALTHYFAIGAIASLIIYAVAYLQGSARRTTLAAFACAFVLGSLLWAHEFVLQWHSFDASSVSWLYDPSSHFIAVTLIRILLLPGRFLVDSKGILQAGSIVLAIVFLVPLLGRKKSRGMFWWLWLVGTIAPVAAEDLIHHYKQLGLIRYTLLATPAVYVLLATVVQWARGPGWVNWAVPVAAAICCVGALPRQAYHPQWHSDWRRLADTIQASRQSGEVICFVGPCDDGFWYPDGLYAPLAYYLHPMPGPVILMFDPPTGKPMPSLLTDTLGPVALWAIVAGGGTDAAWPPLHWTIDQQSQFDGIGTLEHLHRK